MSISTLPARLPTPASPRAASECMPAVQWTTSSPNAAASAKLPSLARSPASAAHATAFSLPAWRDPIITSWPSSTSFVASAWPTIPVPSTAILIGTLLASSTRCGATRPPRNPLAERRPPARTLPPSGREGREARRLIGRGGWLGRLRAMGEEHCAADDRGEGEDPGRADPPSGERFVEDDHSGCDRERV